MIGLERFMLESASCLELLNSKTMNPSNQMMLLVDFSSEM